MHSVTSRLIAEHQGAQEVQLAAIPEDKSFKLVCEQIARGSPKTGQV